ncbi:MraY family glycosyltransferase [Microvirga alba]|uniref:Glycosyltransferase family 4 protein n=1 Tax=Microvirga alba TaxID=2791025 RepID=A0A931BUU9_9HYPH|nr:glycosyltransferase family 4 protein [Microvirga alba]MBF9233252.1 glycosyltransferase family 4 protein [Microvirga alba]
MISAHLPILITLSIVLIASAALSALLIVVLKPLLIRYALARPNARSSHKVPTPQGGGIAIIVATVIVLIAVAAALGASSSTFAILATSTIVLAFVGAIDDIRPLPAGPRLALQVIAVAAVVLTSDARVFPDAIPLGLERAFLILAGVWFVNLVNFMDGLDWITVAEMVPITAFLALLGVFGPLSPLAALAAAALCGALLGFAPFNKPVARLFMGDVGSLPIGLLVGWLLLQLAGTGALAAAILLPLYHLMDATITLLRRLARREKVWEAHRSHFYQRATDNGFSALSVSGHVFALNIMLGGLAAVTIIWPSALAQAASLVAGVALVSLLLRHFSTRRPEVSR